MSKGSESCMAGFSMEITALEKREIGHRTLCTSYTRCKEITVPQATQFGTEIDEAFGQNMDDEASALQAAAHGEEA